MTRNRTLRISLISDIIPSAVTVLGSSVLVALLCDVCVCQKPIPGAVLSSPSSLLPACHSMCQSETRWSTCHYTSSSIRRPSKAHLYNVQALLLVSIMGFTGCNHADCCMSSPCPEEQMTCSPRKILPAQGQVPGAWGGC